MYTSRGILGTTYSRDASSSKKFHRHDYHDYGTVTMRDYMIAQLKKNTLSKATHGNGAMELVISSRTSRTAIPFPTKLHLVLSIADSEGFDHVISWQPHGRCFLIHDHQEFVDKVLPIYFGQTRITSFRRQLNMHGFLRLSKGPDKGCYYHELFLKHKLFLCQDIVRIGEKETGVKLKTDHSYEPDFYSMRFVEPDKALTP